MSEALIVKNSASILPPDLAEMPAKTDPKTLGSKVIAQSDVARDSSAQARDLGSIEAIHISKDSRINSLSTKIAQLAHGVSVSFFKACRTLLMTGAPSAGVRKKQQATVYTVSGSPQLAKAVPDIASFLAEGIHGLLVDPNSEQIMNNFFKGEKQTLKSLLEDLLPTLYINLSKYASEHSGNEYRDLEGGFTPVKAVSVIVQMFNTHFPHITTRIAAIDKIRDPEKFEKKFRDLFTPLVDDIIAAFFPNGPQDFPLLEIPFFTKSVWSKFKHLYLPNLLIDLYTQFRAPHFVMPKEKLAAMPNGHLLVSFAETMATSAPELIPQIFVDQAFLSSISDHLKGFFEGSDHLKNWLATWVSSVIGSFGKSQDPEIKKIWTFFASYLEPFLVHIFIHLAEKDSMEKEQGATEDAIGTMIRKLTLCLCQFFDGHKAAIDTYIESHATSSENFSAKPEFIALMKPLSDSLLKICGLERADLLPLPVCLQKIIYGLLQEHLPRFLAKQYHAIKGAPMDDAIARRRLRSFFFDDRNIQNPQVTVKVVSALFAIKDESNPAFEEFFRKLWKESGTEDFVQWLESILKLVSVEIADSLVASLNLGKESKSLFLKQITQFLSSFCETALVKIFADFLDSSKDACFKTKPSSDMCLLNVFKSVVDLFSKHLKGMGHRIQKMQSEESKNAERRDIFKGLAKDIQEFCPSNPLTHLPFDGLPGGESLKSLLWDKVKLIVLPEFLSRTYLECTSWISQKEKTTQKIDKYFHTTHPFWSSKLFSQYASDRLRNFLESGSDNCAHLLLYSIRQHFENSKSPDKAIAVNYLLKHHAKAKKTISSMLKIIAKGNNKSLDQIWVALVNYLDSSFMEFFKNLSANLQEIEEKNPDLMVDLASGLLKDAADYFKTLNRITSQNNAEHAFKLSERDVILGFGFDMNLHRGIPYDFSASESEKEAFRIQKSYIPRTRKILKLANIKMEDLPVPSFLRSVFGEVLTKKLLPLVFLQADRTLLEPPMRDILMLKFVQTLYATLNAITFPTNNEIIEEFITHQDPKQKRLNESCGAVVLELVKLIPDTMVQYVFMKEKVKNISAAALGEAIMPLLSKWTLLQVVDAILYSSITGLHPSKWEGKAGRETLVPRKLFTRPDGKTGIKKANRFKFIFPITPKEIQAELDFKTLEARRVSLQLRDAFTQTISSQMVLKIQQVVKSTWDYHQIQIDDFAKKYLPSFILPFKRFVDSCFHIIFIDVIGSILELATSPVFKLIKLIIEKMYIDHRSDEMIKNLHSEGFDILLYRWVDTFLDTLLKAAYSPEGNKSGV